MNDIDKAGTIYLSKCGVPRERIARALNATKKEVEETIRQYRKGAWNDNRRPQSR